MTCACRPFLFGRHVLGKILPVFLMLWFCCGAGMISTVRADDSTTKQEEARRKEARKNEKIVMKKTDDGSDIDNQDAMIHFRNLFKAVQRFSVVLLFLGIVLAGILFMTGKTSFFLMTLGGSVVVFGGPYIVGLVMDALLSKPKEVLFTDAYQVEFLLVPRATPTVPKSLGRKDNPYAGFFRFCDLNQNPLEATIFKPGIHVASLTKDLDISSGTPIAWKKDGMGRPMVTIAIRPTLFHIPTDANGQPIPQSPPVKTTMTIGQNVVFDQAKDESWMAISGPLIVTMDQNGSGATLVDPGMNRDKWSVPVGDEGIVITNLMGAGLSDSESDLKKYFTDQELHQVANSKEDAVFLLHRSD